MSKAAAEDAGTPLSLIRTAAAAVPMDDVADVLDLEVPRWQDKLAVHVRYHRLDHRAIRRHLTVPEKRQKQDPHGWDLVAAQNLLVEACVGIFVTHNGETLAFNDDDLLGTWPTFTDVDVLAANLGRTITTAREAVKAIYLADGDIIAASSRFAAWCGYGDDVVERTQGN